MNEEQVWFNAVREAEHLCPVNLSHLEKQRWKAAHIRAAVQPSAPAAEPVALAKWHRAQAGHCRHAAATTAMKNPELVREPLMRKAAFHDDAALLIDALAAREGLAAPAAVAMSDADWFANACAPLFAAPTAPAAQPAEDAARLDWLEDAQALRIDASAHVVGGTYRLEFSVATDNLEVGRGQSLRAAIDAARQSQQPGSTT